jgi:hypothetical protein
VKLRSVEESWQSFVSHVIPKLKPGDIQYDEMRIAFYAATWVMIQGLIKIGDNTISSEQGAEWLSQVERECTEHRDAIIRLDVEKN